MPRITKTKLLLMGRSEVGKTSMRSVIFASRRPEDTDQEGPTLRETPHDHELAGRLVLNLWDCGGQDSFYVQYFEQRREFIYSQVSVLVYVFAINSNDKARDDDYFEKSLEALKEFSPNAKVYCLLHKTDLLPTVEQRNEAFKAFVESHTGYLKEKGFLIEEQNVGDGSIVKAPQTVDVNKQFFSTSIYDSSLFTCWSTIAREILPNKEGLRNLMMELLKEADLLQIFLLERRTYLLIESVFKERSIVDIDHYSREEKRAKLSFEDLEDGDRFINGEDITYTDGKFTVAYNLTDFTRIYLIWGTPLNDNPTGMSDPVKVFARYESRFREVLKPNYTQ